MKFNKEQLAWASYDWANSAFATTVMAGFFPVFFKQYWSDGVDASESTFWLGLANSVAAILVALTAPVLGAMADAGGNRKHWLFGFMLLGVTATLAMYWVAKGDWVVAALCMVLGTIGFAGGNSFYDSLLVDISEPQQRGSLSTFAYAIGYLGGGILFVGQVIVALDPEVLGIEDKPTAVKLAFASCAAWWLLFSIPVFTVVKERRISSGLGFSKAAKQGFRQLAHTFRSIRQQRNVFLFLLAFWLYIDGVHTIIKMAVDYGIALGFPSDSLIKALLVTQFVGFPAAIAYGWLGNKIGIRNAISLAILVYMGVTVWGMGLETETEFYLMAGTIGLVQGGIQGLSRAYYSQLIPANASAEYFGFYNMLGKFAAVLGPLLMGSVTLITDDPRLGIFSIIILFAAGLIMLRKVDDPIPD